MLCIFYHYFKHKKIKKSEHKRNWIFEYFKVMGSNLTFIFHFISSFMLFLNKWIIIIITIIISLSRKPVVCRVLKMVFHFIIQAAWILFGENTEKSIEKVLIWNTRMDLPKFDIPLTVPGQPPPSSPPPPPCHKKMERDNRKNHPGEEKGRISYKFNKLRYENTQICSSSLVSP